MSSGVYIHIPFCRKKCHYCGFYSLPLDSREARDAAAVYIFALKREMKTRLSVLPDSPVDTVYFGGGTPSVFRPEELRDVLEFLNSISCISGDAEISVEINPSDISPAYLSGLIDAGFNRMILGVQTLNSAYHKTIGRAHELCTEKRLDMFFSCAGVACCIDLITGIPGQDICEFRTELERVLNYGPEHVSAYLLSIEEGTPLAGRIAYSEGLESLQHDAFMETRRVMLSRGYRHYEISNYAKPGFESRHNLKYWTFQPYIGLGPGAHSFMDGERYVNRMSVREYLEGKVAPERDERTEKSGMVEFIMTGLRMINGFSPDDFVCRFGVVIPESVQKRIAAQKEKGNLCTEEDEDGRTRICLTETGLLFADGIIYDILQDIL